jgi:hypothetical protein
MFKISLKSFINGAAAHKVFVLNFEFRSFEFVSNFVLRISNFLNINLHLSTLNYSNH